MVLKQSIVEKVLTTGIMFLINIVALVGNLLLFVVTCSKRTRKSSIKMLLLALCIADLITATFDIPLTIVSLIRGRWIFGYTACQIQGFTAILTGMASTQIVTLVSINRYCCVVRRNLYHRWFTPRSCLSGIISAWLFSLLTVIAVVSTSAAEFRYYDDRVTCFMAVTDPTVEAVYSVFVLLTFIIFPFVVMLYCYSKVLTAVTKHKKNLRNSRILSAEEIDLTYSFLALVLGFLTCLFPVFVLELVDTFCRECMTRASNLTHIFCFYASSATNFLIYGIMNRSFRCSLAKMLHRLRYGREMNNEDQRPGHTSAWVVRTVSPM